MTILRISAPQTSLIVPIGPAGCGKSTLLGQFADSISDPGWRFGNDDVRRALDLFIYESKTSAAVASAALAMVGARLVAKKGAALDSTHNGQHARRSAIELARRNGVAAVGLLSRVDLAVVLSRNENRPKELFVPESIILDMFEKISDLSVESLLGEGFDRVYEFNELVTELVIDFV